MKLFKKFLLTVMAFAFVAVPLSVVNAQEDEETAATFEDYADFDWEAYYQDLSDTYDSYDDTSYTYDLEGEDAEAAIAALLGGTAILGVVIAIMGGFGVIAYI